MKTTSKEGSALTVYAQVSSDQNIDESDTYAVVWGIDFGNDTEKYISKFSNGSKSIYASLVNYSLEDMLNKTVEDD